MIGGAEMAVIFLPLDKTRGAVVSDASLPLQPACGRLLIIEDELAGLAIKLRVGAVVRESGAIKGKAAVFRYFGTSLDIVGLALRAQVVGHGAAFVLGQKQAVTQGKPFSNREIKHVATSAELFPTSFHN